MGFLFRLIFGGIFGKARPPPEQSRRSVQTRKRRPADVEKAYTKPALREADIRLCITNLPWARILHVVDGDSVVVTIDRDECDVRLDSIDCPEDGQPWGDIAAYGLIKLVGGRMVHLEQHGQDIYGRTLATIYVQRDGDHQWMNVNERMVMLGHAWVSRAYCGHLPPDRQQKLNRLQSWARSKKVGLWHEPNPTPPWNWRKTTDC